MTQTEKVLNHLKKNKYIDRAIAINRYNIFNLPDVIMRLRRSGHPIETVEKKGKDGKWARYTLGK